MNLFAINDIHRAFGTHHRDFGGGPCEIHIAANVFGIHHAIRAAVRFARNDRNFWHRRFAIRKQQFRAVSNHAAVFLTNARQKSGHIFQRQNRDIETIAKAHKARAFDRRVNVEDARENHRLLRDDADDAPIHARKTDYDISREMFLHLKKIAVVHNASNDIFYIIRFVRIVRHNVVELFIRAQGRVCRRAARRVFGVVLRQKRKQRAKHVHRFFFTVRREMRDAAG